MIGQAADRPLIGPGVVVDDDDHAAVPGRGDVVQGFPGHPAGQGTVADHGDHAAVGLPAQLVALGQAVGVGQAGGRVRVLDQVVLGLAAARISGEPAALAQRVEGRVPPGEQLVDIGLVAGVEQDPVDRGIKDPVQRDGEFHYAQVRAEMTAGPGHRADQAVPDLRG